MSGGPAQGPEAQPSLPVDGIETVPAQRPARFCRGEASARRQPCGVGQRLDGGRVGFDPRQPRRHHEAGMRQEFLSVCGCCLRPPELHLSPPVVALGHGRGPVTETGGGAGKRRAQPVCDEGCVEP